MLCRHNAGLTLFMISGAARSWSDRKFGMRRQTTPPTSREINNCSTHARTRRAVLQKMVISGSERLRMRVWNAQWRRPAGRCGGRKLRSQ